MFWFLWVLFSGFFFSAVTTNPSFELFRGFRLWGETTQDGA